jgi:hypothetical protein
MKTLVAVFLCALSFLSREASGQNVPAPHLPADDGVRIKEFYRLASSIQDEIWPGWSKVPSPLIVVTADTEFLTHDPTPPAEFKKFVDDLYTRARQFPADLQATMPAFGPPAVMIVGEPTNTESKTSTAWEIIVMHEHFHQLQWAQPGYMQAVEALNLSRGDQTGMWMLNYPFPYDKPEVAQAFARLRDLLLRAVNEPDGAEFQKLAGQYVAERPNFFALVSADDRKYFGFQLWQEGIARYTETKAAEAAANYKPTREFAALADYESFASYATRKRAEVLDELKRADLPTKKRAVVYPFGAAEGFLLDRINPKWKDDYFKHMLSLDSCFEGLRTASTGPELLTN